MEQLLKWIEERGFVLYKDGRWYSPKEFKGRPSIYYTHKELTERYGIEEQKEEAEK